jgi:hypothetical protein
MSSGHSGRSGLHSSRMQAPQLIPIQNPSSPRGRKSLRRLSPRVSPRQLQLQFLASLRNNYPELTIENIARCNRVYQKMVSENKPPETINELVNLLARVALRAQHDVPGGVAAGVAARAPQQPQPPQQQPRGPRIVGGQRSRLNRMSRVNRRSRRSRRSRLNRTCGRK